LLYLTFALAAAEFQPVVVSVDAGARDSGCGGVHATERTSGAESPSVREPLVDIETAHTHEASMSDIVLVSGHARTVNRDAVYGLLIECL
jgi:hypothetical protein